MERIINFLNKLEIWFFYGFLLTFTLSIRKVLFFYPIREQFNEYTGIYIYLSDIFLLFVLIITGLSILYNKILSKSRSNPYFVAYLKQKVVIIPLLLVIFSFISAFWSDNWQVAIFRSIKLLEFYLLYLWVIFRLFHACLIATNCSTPAPLQENVPRGTFSLLLGWNTIKKNLFLIIISIGIAQSFIGIWQFIVQKSIGLIWLKESIISSDISGVAKIVLNGEKYIRSYGLFPHPNILGGFLVLSIILTVLYFKVFHPSQIVPRGTIDGASVEQLTGQAWNNSMYYSVLGIQLLTLVLTFSKSAWIGLIIAVLYLWYKNVPPQYKCSTWNILRGRRGTFLKFVARKLKYFGLIVSIIFLLIFIIRPNWYSIIGKSIEDRMFYLNVSRGTFLENPVIGVGIGQYVYQLANVSGIQNWQFQPVHNVFLLILNELGIIGLILFVWFIWEVAKNFPYRKFPEDKLHLTLKSLFFGFLFIMLFDHYFWDIQQGQIIFWLILGLIIGSKVWISNKTNAYPQDKA
ncbi:MAG: O-antigen ligase family protein [Patescibacteria group bacterium]